MIAAQPDQTVVTRDGFRSVGDMQLAQQVDDVDLVDFGFFEFHELFDEESDQIGRVEELSDAYHLTLGGRNVMVAYLVEVTHKNHENQLR